jgi:uncharacterized delta-60 repeat protein
MRPTISLLTLILLLITSSSFSQAGTLDTTFSSDGMVFKTVGPHDSQVNAVAIQKDGKILVAGYTILNKKKAFLLLRFKPNGSPDRGFGRNGLVKTEFITESVANAIAIQEDGKIILAGGAPGFVLVRYNQDGSVDSTFGSNGSVINRGGLWSAYAVAIQPDGKLIAGGGLIVPNSGGALAFALTRYNSNGNLDNSFGDTGIVVTRLDTNNFYDRADDECKVLLIQPDGKIIAAGYTGNGSPFSYAFGLVRYKEDGIIDSSFGNAGKVITQAYFRTLGSSAALQPNGKIIIAGWNSPGLGDNNFALARYKKNGSRDSSFAQNGIDTIDFYHYSDQAATVAIQANGKIIVVGSSGGLGTSYISTAQLKANGSLDNSFGTNGRTLTDLDMHFIIKSGLLQPDGKIVVAGSASKNGESGILLVRYNGDPVTENHFSDNILSKQNLVNTSAAYVSPNPVKDILHIQNLSSSTKTISIFDLRGKILQQVATANNSYTLNVSQLPAGMYFVKVIDDRKTTTLKFIKE